MTEEEKKTFEKAQRIVLDMFEKIEKLGWVLEYEQCGLPQPNGYRWVLTEHDCHLIYDVTNPDAKGYPVV